MTLRPWRKALPYLALLLLVGAALALGRQSLGAVSSVWPFPFLPRMKSQSSIKPFEQAMPEMPLNLVPITGLPAFPKTEKEAAQVANPVKPTDPARTLGRIYYGYYCLMCHGEKGDGDGPVGRSYLPTPADLRSAEVQSLSDGALCFRMTAGAGHEPVMKATVPLERRWHIVHHLRTFSLSR